MQLIGMLDSPFVRRAAVSLHVLGVPFRHRSLSVFRTYEEFRKINPVVKAPTLVCDDGTVLMDSTLILEYAETLAAPKTLLPAEGAERLAALRIVGLTLAACEKTVQIFYERNLRPLEKQHEPWMERIAGQLRCAYLELESDFARQPQEAAQTLGAAQIAAAVAWHFTQRKLPELVSPSQHPRLAALSSWAERQQPFLAWPYDEVTLHV